MGRNRGVARRHGSREGDDGKTSLSCSVEFEVARLDPSRESGKRQGWQVGVNLLNRPRTVRVWRRHFVRTFPSPGRHTAARSSFPAMFFAMIEVIKGAGP